MEENIVEKVKKDTAELEKVYYEYYDKWQNISETSKPDDKQPKKTDMVTVFRNGWDTVVGVFTKLFGIKGKTARNTLLVAIVPLLTAAVQMLNWAYLYVHYHLGYNVPVEYLIVDTSWLVNFGIGVFIVSVLFVCDAYALITQRLVSTAVVLAVFSLAILYTIGSDGFEFAAFFVKCLAWMVFFSTLFSVLTGIGNPGFIRGHLAVILTVLLDAFTIIIICKWLVESPENNSMWLGFSGIAYWCMAYWFVVLDLKPQKREVIWFQVCVLLVSTVFFFFLFDDCYTRVEPYSVITTGQQVVVYQSKEVSVLEEVSIDTEAGKTTLTIDTSQQQIVDSTTLSFEYQSFDTVEIVKKSDKFTEELSKEWKQMQEEIESVFDRIANLVGAESTGIADTSTAPADGAASYDTSN
ncbi:MAG: hypothetical protein LUE89_03345 [Clostridiales bacterium]|nr:hypothetical protein [Clostridiales bacterium]